MWRDGRTTAATAALCCLLAFFSSNRASAERERFEGQRVLRIYPQTEADVKLLSDLEEAAYPQLDFWKAPGVPRRPVDVRVPREISESFIEVLRSNRVAHSVLIEDLQRAIDDELPKARSKRQSRRDLLSTYGSHDEINQWLDEAAKHCGTRCTVVTIGSSYEGRTMKAIRVTGLNETSANSSGNSSTGGKPAVWIDAGLHAREWIAPAVAIGIIDTLITTYATSPCTKLLLDEFVWYVLPSANPDGYEFSRTQNRMWRKNRKPAPARCRPPPSPPPPLPRGMQHLRLVFPWERAQRSCNGTDLNRNFGYQWGGVGASCEPCAETFCGAQAFSEPETRSVSGFLLSLRPQLKVYLSLHSYGQYWLYPWAYAKRRPEDNHISSVIAVEAASSMIEASGLRTLYNVGPAGLTLYPASGGSDDWAKAAAGVRYTFTAELPPSDREPLPSGGGFLVPESDIARVAHETWHGVRAMAATALQFERGASAAEAASLTPTSAALRSIRDACPRV